MRKFLASACTLLMVMVATGQDPHFSQFFASPLTLNPAFTGKFDGSWRLAANHRDQWPSIPKAYVTTSASLDLHLLGRLIPQNDVFGVGVSGLTDASANGILKLTYGSVSLSYHKSLNENGTTTIGAGFQGTYSSMLLDIDKLTFEDMLTQNGFTGTTSEVLINGHNQNYFDMNAGLLFSGSTNGENNFYVGASMYHINRPKVSFKDKNWYLSGRITGHAGGSLPLSDVITVHGSAIYQLQNKASETTVGAAIAANFNRDATNPSSIYLGSWYRFGDALIPYVGIEFGGLRIGASYDVNVSSLKAATASRGGSEISLIYIKRPAEPKGVPCPKF
ncbi:MAG: PorP/SprF family type IX secretion system membrane protein [Ferruginibacter sp.]